MTIDEDAMAREQRTQIAVQLATLQGKIDTVIARMEAGDRQGEQLVALTKDQIKFLAADTGELKAIVREQTLKTDSQIAALTAKTDSQISALATRAENGLSTVRTDLERQIEVTRGELDKRIRDTMHPVDERVKVFSDQMDDLRLWRARIVGMAIGASILSSGITAGILRGLGAG